MEPIKLFSIGDVAKLFHLSVSSLRHYEAAGLLQPEWVDPQTGYRYYSTRQFEVLNTIRYLRALDMPLPEIADFCGTGMWGVWKKSCVCKGKRLSANSRSCGVLNAK